MSILPRSPRPRTGTEELNKYTLKIFVLGASLKLAYEALGMKGEGEGPSIFWHAMYVLNGDTLQNEVISPRMVQLLGHGKMEREGRAACTRRECSTMEADLLKEGF